MFVRYNMRVSSNLPPLQPRPEPQRDPRAGTSLPPLGRATPEVAVPVAAIEKATRGRGPRRDSSRGALIGGLVAVAALTGGLTGLLASRSGGGDVQTNPTSLQTSPTEGMGTLQEAISRAEPAMVEIRASDGQGSGVIVAPKNLIVTNEHVVGSQTRVTIVTADGRRMDGDVIRVNAERDLAIIRPLGSVPAGVEIAEGTEASVRLGDSVFAIGSPFGLQNSVSTGIVSATNRDKGGGKRLIQTDAAINPGNSGGGLFDLNARLIGVPTSILSPVKGNVGIGFAVKAADVLTLLSEIP